MSELQKLGEGREAEIFVWGEGLVLRLMRDPAQRQRLEAQASALAAAKAAGAPVPSPGEIVEVDGRPGLVMQRARGGDLLTLLGSRPWRVASFGKLTARVHHSLLSVKAPGETRSSKEYLAAKIQGSGLDSPRLEAVMRLLATLPDGDRLCHGDFHPGNILFDDGSPLVIDWSNVSSGDPLNDVARSLMTLRIGQPPPGTPALVMKLLKIGRAIYFHSYRSQIERLIPIDERRLNNWLAVHLAARVVEAVGSEGDRIDAWLDQTLG